MKDDSPCLTARRSSRVLLILITVKSDMGKMPQLTFTTCVTSLYTSDALLLRGQAAEELRAAGPELCQCSVHVLSQPVVLHQLGVDPPPRHLFFHEATFHDGTQLLLLRHLTLQARNLFTALCGGKQRRRERLAHKNTARRLAIPQCFTRNMKRNRTSFNKYITVKRSCCQNVFQMQNSTFGVFCRIDCNKN